MRPTVLHTAIKIYRGRYYAEVKRALELNIYKTAMYKCC